ncbi:phospholipase D-like domain-containing protein DpdK [Peribacillus simplex]|uniref:phospholipase D-like domain-containing protein DpdK n=1 Tax=Peribacillus simplex TaxID=1478 RepID=UPI0024C1171A|nr:phospholipase D-like domain-containing protein DpdK [Peribacillus simplex]WHY58649.1 phospholipase D-like domain-containing protein DpdK [Peribacillus simplex]
MHNRTIRSHNSSVTLIDCLASIFSLEAVLPSKEIYLISPFLSNSPLIRNRLGQYSDLFPMIEGKIIYLSDILNTLSWKGSKIRIICDPNRVETKRFISQLNEVEIKKLNNNHEKGLMTSHIYLHGSMNFTFSGININGENIRITSDRSEVNQALLAARTRWEEAEEICHNH